MKIYESNDRGDRFVVGMPDTWQDGRPLAKVLRLRARQHKAHAKICRETAEDLSRNAQHLLAALEALKATGVWRERSPPRAHALPPELRGHIEASDPAIRALLRALHAITTASKALEALAAKDLAGE